MMKKFTVIVAFLALIVSLPFVAAFEAHVINVVAQIDNALSVTPLSVEYGSVFPQEKLDRTFEVELSGAFLQQSSSISTQYASGVVSSAQGTRKNGTAVLPDRTDPTDALGAPQSTGAAYDSPVIAGSFFALGFNTANPTGPGGNIVLSFTNYIVDVPGNDITIYEITGGTSYPNEYVKIEASQDGTTWFTLLASGLKDLGADLAAAGLPWAKYVRLTEVSPMAPFETTADGYDLDGVVATSQEFLGAVDYIVRQKPKCWNGNELEPVFGVVTEDEQGNFVCVDEGFTQLPLLCPYLSKHEITTDGPQENDSVGINAFHGLPLPWTLATTVATEVSGSLEKDSPDTQDTWNIDLRVPCFADECAQDWPDFVRTESGNPEIDTELYKANPLDRGLLFGCDLWVEVTNIF